MKGFTANVLISRLGRRIVLLFVLCALVPITAVAGFSLLQTHVQLDHQMVRWLHQEAKARGLAIFERVTLLDRELEVCVSAIRQYPKLSDLLDLLQRDSLKSRFRSLFMVQSKSVTAIFGDAAIPRPLTSEERAHMAKGKALLLVAEDGSGSRVFLARLFVPEEPDSGVLWGELNTSFIMGLMDEAGYGEKVRIVLFDHGGKLIHATGQINPVFQEELRKSLQSSTSSEFHLTMDSRRYISYSWPVYLKAEFHASSLTVLFCIPEEDVFALPYTIKDMLPRVLAVTILAVFLLSLVQVRRQLQPLKALTEGTKRIAEKHYDTRVAIVRRDEFGELANSFNDMALHLESQFNTLNAISEIDRAILSSLKRDEIVETVLNQMKGALSFDLVGLILAEHGRHGGLKTFTAQTKGGQKLIADKVSALPSDIFKDCRDRIISLKREDNRLPSFLKGEGAEGIETFFLLPVSSRQDQPDLLILGLKNQEGENNEILVHARSVADQVEVALVNASLLEELQDMSWGALQALARAVDAKSPWTSGHSERVTLFALKIGEVLHLNDKQMETLHRGSLLHDIGKIGVSNALLDKPDRLTPDEFEVIKSHPGRGGKILEPIKAYSSELNIVVQHHERFDGNGYPKGLSGEQIDYGARIVAVADVFDAVSSDRPYRKGWEFDQCVGLIQDGRGLAFDPGVVDGFLQIVAREGKRMMIRLDQGRPSELFFRK